MKNNFEELFKKEYPNLESLEKHIITFSDNDDFIEFDLTLPKAASKNFAFLLENPDREPDSFEYIERINVFYHIENKVLLYQFIFNDCIVDATDDISCEYLDNLVIQWLSIYLSENKIWMLLILLKTTTKKYLSL